MSSHGDLSASEYIGFHELWFPGDLVLKIFSFTKGIHRRFSPFSLLFRLISFISTWSLEGPIRDGVQ